MIPSQSDAPFHCPNDIVLDLPAPISVNRLWRVSKSSVIKSDVYTRWLKTADNMLLEMGQLRGVKPIAGKFTALIVLKRSRIDIDNGAKCCLDFLQSRNFIVNDKLCEELTLRWGDAPTGCRVTIKAIINTMGDVLRRAQDHISTSA
jgi:Holliday junction resolvase RusA-like endonuclease